MAHVLPFVAERCIDELNSANLIIIPRLKAAALLRALPRLLAWELSKGLAGRSNRIMN